MQMKREIDLQSKRLDSMTEYSHIPYDSHHSAGVLENLQAKVRDLEAVKKMFLSADANPTRSLVTLDVSGHRVKAAVATGDLDRADHVIVFVPGMGTRVDSTLDKYVDDSERILKLSHKELDRIASTNTAASVAWLGYDAPAALGEDNYYRVAGTSLAHTGADRLIAFSEGMESTHRTHGSHDAHLTVVGHSYGSTTSGFAAANVKPGVIDDLILFGSPGSGVQSVGEYNITSPHPYVIGVDSSQDAVQDAGFDWTFGKDPMQMDGFVHLDNYSPSMGDGKGGWFSRHGTDVYLHKDSNSLRDIARVSAGTFERS